MTIYFYVISKYMFIHKKKKDKNLNEDNIFRKNIARFRHSIALFPMKCLGQSLKDKTLSLSKKNVHQKKLKKFLISSTKVTD